MNRATADSIFIHRFVDSVTTRPFFADLIRMRSSRRQWGRRREIEALRVPYPEPLVAAQDAA